VSVKGKYCKQCHVLCCTEILQAAASAAIAALAFEHRDNQKAFVAEGVVK